MEENRTLHLLCCVLTPEHLLFLLILPTKSANSICCCIRVAAASWFVLSDLTSPPGSGVRKGPSLPQTGAADKWSPTTHQADGQAHHTAGSGEQAHAEVGCQYQEPIQCNWRKWAFNLIVTLELFLEKNCHSVNFSVAFQNGEPVVAGL